MNTGFSGADLLLDGLQSAAGDNLKLPVLVSTAVAAANQTQPTGPVVKVVYDQWSHAQEQIQEELQRQTSALGWGAKFDFISKEAAAASATDFTDSMCIFLPAFDRPLLRSLSNNDLSLLKKIYSQAKGMMWVSAQSVDPAASPSHALVLGLSRTLSSEDFDFSSVTITVEAPYTPVRVVDHVIKVLLNNPQKLEDSYENDYIERNGVLCVPRLVECPEVTARLYPDSDTQQLVHRRWNDENEPPLKLVLGTVGLLDSLGFEEYEGDITALRSDEVEVRVSAVGLNFIDVVTALGQTRADYLGNELAGVVTSVGTGNTTDLEVGDTVIGLALGTMRTMVRCKAYQLHKLPAGVSLLAGVALPLVYCTAYYAIVTWARAEAGESILIHSGAGGVGQAAIQLAKILGLTIFTTTSTDEKVQLLMDVHGIPRSHIFSSRSLDFATGIHRMTGGVGVDIILNSLGGEGLKKSWEILAPFGRFIELGKDFQPTGSSPLGGLSMQPFDRNVMFASVDIPALYKTRDRISGILSAVVQLAAEGRIAPSSPLQVFKGSEIRQAFRLMQTGKHTGKLVIEFSREDVVEAKKLKLERTSFFDGRSTYIIAGGLGGIAISICKWMVRKGARHIALMARSKIRDPETISFLDDLREKGAQVVAYPCDVSDAVRLRTVLSEIERTMPPVRGCVQAAMVLRVSKCRPSYDQC
jgi:NADPH:quinone reductase-like Zn-dependent oxidoreductase